jgi:hypothetical protein
LERDCRHFHWGSHGRGASGGRRHPTGAQTPGECTAAAAALSESKAPLRQNKAFASLLPLNLKQFQHRIKMQSPQPSGSQSQPETTVAEPKLLDKNADSRQASRAPPLRKITPFSNS